MRDGRRRGEHRARRAGARLHSLGEAAGDPRLPVPPKTRAHRRRGRRARRTLARADDGAQEVPGHGLRGRDDIGGGSRGDAAARAAIDEQFSKDRPVFVLNRAVRSLDELAGFDAVFVATGAAAWISVWCRAGTRSSSTRPRPASFSAGRSSVWNRRGHGGCRPRRPEHRGYLQTGSPGSGGGGLGPRPRLPLRPATTAQPPRRRRARRTARATRRRRRRRRRGAVCSAPASAA